MLICSFGFHFHPQFCRLLLLTQGSCHVLHPGLEAPTNTEGKLIQQEKRTFLPACPTKQTCLVLDDMRTSVPSGAQLTPRYMETNMLGSLGEPAVDCEMPTVRHSTGTGDLRSVPCIQGLAEEEKPSGKRILVKTNSHFLSTWASFWTSPSCPRVGQQWKFPQYSTLLVFKWQCLVTLTIPKQSPSDAYSFWRWPPICTGFTPSCT